MRPYMQEETGSEFRVERGMIDANWGISTDTVYQFCRKSEAAGLVFPSHGRGVTAGGIAMNAYKKKPGDRTGNNWRIPAATSSGRGRHVVYDTNFWKSFIIERLLLPVGTPGGFWVYGSLPAEHQLLFDHLTSEYPVRTFGRGREVEEWKLRPDARENHWLDCLAGCAVGASILGVSAKIPESAWSESSPPRGGEKSPEAGRPVKLSEIQKAKRQ
jgi:hypothetical protein